MGEWALMATTHNLIKLFRAAVATALRAPFSTACCLVN